MTSTFQIDKPTSDTNWFTLLLKYTALFMLLWIAAWFAVFYVMEREREPALDEAVFSNGGLMSALIAALVVAFLLYRTWNKYRFGAAFAFRFDDEAQVLSIGIVNTMNGREKEKKIPYGQLRLTERIKEDPLFGVQHIFDIHNRSLLINTVNIELTAWVRHPELPELLGRFRNFSSTSTDTESPA